MATVPNKNLHMLMDFHFLNAPYGSTSYIHDILDHGDIGYVKLFGVKHRHFMHDNRAVQWIEANHGAYAALVARLHICLDIVWSQGKREMTGNGRRNKR